MFYIFTCKQQKIQSIAQIQDLIQSRNESIGLKPSYFFIVFKSFFYLKGIKFTTKQLSKTMRTVLIIHKSKSV